MIIFETIWENGIYFKRFWFYGKLERIFSNYSNIRNICSRFSRLIYNELWTPQCLPVYDCGWHKFDSTSFFYAIEFLLYKSSLYVRYRKKNSLVFKSKRFKYTDSIQLVGGINFDNTFNQITFIWKKKKKKTSSLIAKTKRETNKRM